MKVNFEIIPKTKQKTLTFGDLSNGDIFKFKNPDADTFFLMKVTSTFSSAMKLSSTSDILKVSTNAEVEKYEYKILIEGKQ